MREPPMAAGDELAKDVVVTVDGGAKLASTSAESLRLRRRWGSGPRYGEEGPYEDGENGEDPWALPTFGDGPEETGGSWAETSGKEKLHQILRALSKFFALLMLLYTFVCSLDMLSSAFRLVGGRSAGQVFKNSKLLKNPVVGLMIGVLATASLQSSSTSTSVVVTMVGTKLLSVRNAIPIVMGANIGTSVTNTLVSLGQSSERPVFRRAFAAATLHDMFNWLAVLFLLPLEVATGYLELLTGAIVEGAHFEKPIHINEAKDLNDSDNKVEKVQLQQPPKKQHASLQTLTKPFTSLVVQLDKKHIEDLATGRSNDTEKSFLKSCGPSNGTSTHHHRCGYLLGMLGWPDEWAGCLLMVGTMVLLVGCLTLLVKLLRSIMKGRMAFVVRRLINADPPFPYNLVAGYAAMAVGCAVTILVQSSSVFTSALTPLAGIGLVSLERIYPLTLGANLGTTTTSVLAAFAAPTESLPDTLRVALCHLFFNVSGILLFYPLPASRWPIPLAKLLGSTVVKYRWFAFVYLFGMFFMLPGAVFALSMLGGIAFAAIILPILCLFVLVVLINVIQRKRPSMLPFGLRDWSFLPLWMRSLEPMDRLIVRVPCFRWCPDSGGGRDGRVLGTIIPNQSRMNILEPSSASGSALSLASAAEGTNGSPTKYYQAVKGFEECAFAAAMHPRGFQNNNNYGFDPSDEKRNGTKTSSML